MNELQMNEKSTSSTLKDIALDAVSHELRNIFTIIGCYIQILEGHLLDQQTQQGMLHTALSYLSVIAHQTNHLHTIVTELLGLSHFKDGQFELRYSKVNLVQMIRQTIEQHRQLSPDHAFLMRVQDEQEDIIVSCDSTWLEQALTNLLNNAVKYSPPGTSITVGIEHLEQAIQPLLPSVHIWVQDEGCGIREEEQEVIFTPFYRVHTKETAGKEGMGLGLYISAEIIRRHGGRIWLESQLGCGSIFSFSLPLEQGLTESDQQLQGAYRGEHFSR